MKNEKFMENHFLPKVAEMFQVVEQKLFRGVDLVWLDTCLVSFGRFWNFQFFVKVNHYADIVNPPCLSSNPNTQPNFGYPTNFMPIGP